MPYDHTLFENVLSDVKNPFAPPSLPVEAPIDDRGEGRVWRDADRMIVEYGAEFLPICFKTGAPADRVAEVTARWVPVWVYLTLLPGILPYLFISPWFSQRVTLIVPLAEPVFQKYARRAKFGPLMFGIAMIVLVSGFVVPSIEIFLLALVLAIPAAILTTRPAFRLHFYYASRNLIVLRGLHSNCLHPLPEWTRESP